MYMITVCQTQSDYSLFWLVLPIPVDIEDYWWAWYDWLMFLDPIRISSFECESSLIFGVSWCQLCNHRLQMLLEQHLSCYHDNEPAKYFSLSFGGHVRFSEFSFSVYSPLEVMIGRVAICTLYLSSIFYLSLLLPLVEEGCELHEYACTNMCTKPWADLPPILYVNQPLRLLDFAFVWHCVCQIVGLPKGYKSQQVNSRRTWLWQWSGQRILHFVTKLSVQIDMVFVDPASISPMTR